MEMMTQEDFACLPTTRLRAGDVLLFDRRETIGRGVDVASTMIRSVQGRLLRDLGCDGETIARCKNYSHAAVCGFRDDGSIAKTKAMGVPGVWLSYYEMTRPHACETELLRIVPGTVVMVRRQRHGGEDAPEKMGRLVADYAWQDVMMRVKYPATELVTYWLWSWGINKLMLGRKFEKVFTHEADVCSGSVWRWCVAAGLYKDSSATDLRPEAWYPARLAADDERFRTVGVFLIV